MWLFLAAGLQFASTPTRAQTAPSESAGEAPSSGPVRLRQQPQQAQQQPVPAEERPTPAGPSAAPALPYVPGEFERYVQAQASGNLEIRRLGADLMTGGDGRSADLSPIVPPDYVIAPGDEVLITLWGSVDADLRLLVDRSGRIGIPRVGSVQVAGVRHADLADVISRRVALVFKNFQLSVALGQLRGIRVFVTGYVSRPGTYTVSSLSTIVGALMRAGGPAAAGSFRSMELRREGKVVSTFDLYGLLIGGDRTGDQVLQAGDVVNVNSVGIQVGFVGSVNKPAVIELKAGETVADALRFAGGFSAVADRSRLALERLQDRGTARIAQIDLPRDESRTLGHGDVLRAFSAVDFTLPSQRQSKRVRVEGEVNRPAEYVLPEGSSLNDALRAAGGMTPAAFPFATEFARVSVQRTQKENYDRALRDMETDFARSASSQRVSSGDDAAVQAGRAASTNRLIERLRALSPSGRIVLQLEPSSTELPDLALEDGDRIFIPPKPTTVGVFGSVFNAASYLYSPARNVGDYLRLAGGPTKGADEGSVFLIRANGSVISRRQGNSWWRSGSEFTAITAQPGDTLFVPEEMDKTTFVQGAKDWTQILYQFGIGLAGIKSAVR